MARSIWTGTIQFGLVTFPVKLVTAVKSSKKVSFHMLDPEGKCRLRRKLYCPETGEEYDFSDTARGVEIAPDQYVIVQQEEIKELQPESGDAIELQEFIDIAEVDPVYWDRPYYVVPGKGGAKAYQLLLKAMQDSGHVAIGQVVMRQKEHLVTIRPGPGVLMLHIMNYAEEVRNTEELDQLPEEIDLDDRELKMARQLIDSLTDDWDPRKYQDTYQEKLQELVDAKTKGEDVATISAGEEDEGPPVINLMEALKQSLDESKKSRKSKSKPKQRKSA